MDDIAIIYGLEDFQCRTLTAQVAETENINFLVGTQSLKKTNQVHLIQFNDETNHISKQNFDHRAGEIWDLISSFKDPKILATVYYNTQNYHTSCGAAIWKLPDCGSNAENSVSSKQLEKLCDVTNSDENITSSKTYSIAWAPENESKMAVTIDDRLNIKDIQNQAKTVSETKLDGKGLQHLGAVRWCLHQNDTQVAATFGASILAFDTRNINNPVWEIKNAHSSVTRDLDFNPNKQYYVATCGDDGCVKFWDIRSCEKPILTRYDHSHWVWKVRYNVSYDQLVLSCSSDQRVILNNVPSVASQPIDDFATDNSEQESLKSGQENRTQDQILKTYEDHEESVYAAEWSSADFWTFASISFDGRFVINRVPKSFKYKQFM